MKKWLTMLSVLTALMISGISFADGSSPYFNVTASGSAGSASISLCLDGHEPFSCQNYNVSSLTLGITTTLPQRTYASAGIKVNTPGVKISGVGTSCRLISNGYCLFSVSDTKPTTIALLGKIVFTPSTLPAATLNVPYSQTISAYGGVAPYKYAITSGAIPAGLTFNTTTGVLSGTPTTDSVYGFGVSATDAFNNSNNTTYTVTVSGPLPITPTTLSTATLNTAYTATFTASGGVGPYTYAITAGTLPTGLTLNAVSGVVSGIPSVDNIYNFAVTATDSLSHSGSQNYALQVTGSLSLSPTSLATAVINSPYSQIFTTSGGIAPYTYTEVGSLPNGVTLNSATGVLYGTPTTAGTSTFTVSSVDVHGYTGTKTYTLVVSGPLVIMPAALPTATLNAVYNQSLMASGGTAPYTFSLNSGTLPTGITLTSAGVLTGTPTIDNTYSFSIKVTDALAYTGVAAYSLVVSGPLVLTPTTLPAATLNTNYGHTLSTTGGVAPYTYSAAGSLPPGLTLNASSGTISGTPMTDGTYNFSVTVVDSHSNIGTAAYSIVVSGPLVLTPTTLPAATNNIAYNQTISASGGAQPYTYAITAGGLPTGLTLDPSAGAISGTPTTDGTFAFTITATDANGATGSLAYSVQVYIQLDTCVYSTSTTKITCNGVNLLTLTDGTSIYRQYSGSNCPVANTIVADPNKTSYTNTTYVSSVVASTVNTCNMALCNNSTCTTGQTNIVTITTGT